MRVLSVAETFPIEPTSPDFEWNAVHPLLTAEQVKVGELAGMHQPNAYDRLWNSVEEAIANQDGTPAFFQTMEQGFHTIARKESLAGYGAGLALAGLKYYRRRAVPRGMYVNHDDPGKYYQGLQAPAHQLYQRLNPLVQSHESLDDMDAPTLDLRNNLTGALAENVVAALFAKAGAIALKTPPRQENSPYGPYNHDLSVFHQGVWRPVSVKHTQGRRGIDKSIMHVNVTNFFDSQLPRIVNQFQLYKSRPFRDFLYHNKAVALSANKIIYLDAQKKSLNIEATSRAVQELGGLLVDKLTEYPAFEL